MFLSLSSGLIYSFLTEKRWLLVDTRFRNGCTATCRQSQTGLFPFPILKLF